jgi:CRP/FNR family transcriptional regulator, nitrogen oxide reductase regulator
VATIKNLMPPTVRTLPFGTSLAGIPTADLFYNLSKVEINEVLTLGVIRRFTPGRIIVRTNEPITHLFLLKTGSVNYYRLTAEGQEVLITQFYPGDVFGLEALVDEPIDNIGTAETLQESELYGWERRLISQYSKSHPKLVENVLRISLEHNRQYSDRHLALVSDTAEHRLSHILALLANRSGRPSPKGLEIHITNEHLASLADINLFTASRILSKWARAGALKKSRGKVVLHFPQKKLG